MYLILEPYVKKGQKLCNQLKEPVLYRTNVAQLLV